MKFLAGKRLEDSAGIDGQRSPQISTGSRIWDSYRKKVSERTTTNPSSSSSTRDSKQQFPEFSSINPESEESISESLHIDIGEAVTSLNVCLANPGETPYSQVKWRCKGYSQQKIAKLSEGLLKWTDIACERVKDEWKRSDWTVERKVSIYQSPRWTAANHNCFTENFVCTENSRRVLCKKTTWHGDPKPWSKRKRFFLYLPYPKHGFSLPPQAVQLIQGF